MRGSDFNQNFIRRQLPHLPSYPGSLGSFRLWRYGLLGSLASTGVRGQVAATLQGLVTPQNAPLNASPEKPSRRSLLGRTTFEHSDQKHTSVQRSTVEISSVENLSVFELKSPLLPSRGRLHDSKNAHQCRSFRRMSYCDHRKRSAA